MSKDFQRDFSRRKLVSIETSYVKKGWGDEDQATWV